MKSLYESILDGEQVIIDQSMKRLRDVYDILNIAMSNDAWSEVQIARYFKWNDIKNYCKKNGLKSEKGFLPKVFRFFNTCIAAYNLFNHASVL